MPRTRDALVVRSHGLKFFRHTLLLGCASVLTVRPGAATTSRRMRSQPLLLGHVGDHGLRPSSWWSRGWPCAIAADRQHTVAKRIALADAGGAACVSPSARFAAGSWSVRRPVLLPWERDRAEAPVRPAVTPDHCCARCSRGELLSATCSSGGARLADARSGLRSATQSPPLRISRPGRAQRDTDR